MGSINVDVFGLKDVLKMLEAQGAPEKRGVAALRKGGSVICKAAISKAPVRSGELKRSIRVGKRTRAGVYAIEVGVFYPDAAYAHLVERGHEGPKPAPAYPFLWPAVRETEDEAYDAIIRELIRG